jgi:hypothetical protein
VGSDFAWVVGLRGWGLELVALTALSLHGPVSPSHRDRAIAVLARTVSLDDCHRCHAMPTLPHLSQSRFEREETDL